MDLGVKKRIKILENEDKNVLILKKRKTWEL